MAFPEKTLQSEVVYDGPIFRIRKDKVTVVGGKTSYRDILEHNGGAVILAVKEDGRILMVRQFRKALEREVLELPAGKIDGDEDPMDTALRELKEETGYRAGSIRHLTTISPSCGYTTELLYIYLCKNLTPGETHFDDTEDLDLYEYTADELVDWIMKGEIQDAKTIVGVLFARTAGEI